MLRRRLVLVTKRLFVKLKQIGLSADHKKKKNRIKLKYKNVILRFFGAVMLVHKYKLRPTFRCLNEKSHSLCINCFDSAFAR